MKRIKQLFSSEGHAPSGLVWTVVGVLLALVLIVWLVKALD